MPFGLCNTAATFERLIEGVFGQLLWQICLCYLDGILIFSQTVRKHLEHLQAFFQKQKSLPEAETKEVPFFSENKFLFWDKKALALIQGSSENSPLHQEMAMS